MAAPGPVEAADDAHQPWRVADLQPVRVLRPTLYGVVFLVRSGSGAPGGEGALLQLKAVQLTPAHARQGESGLALSLEPHPSIVRCIGAFREVLPQKWINLVDHGNRPLLEGAAVDCLLLEHHPTNLCELLQEQRYRPSVQETLSWMQDIATGLLHLQASGFHLCDLPMDSLLMTASRRIVISDLASAVAVTGKDTCWSCSLQSAVAEEHLLAPEILRSLQMIKTFSRVLLASAQTNMSGHLTFMLGVVLYQIAAGRHPIDAYMRRVDPETTILYTDADIQLLPDAYPAELKEFARSMLSVQSSARPTLEEFVAVLRAHIRPPSQLVSLPAAAAHDAEIVIPSQSAHIEVRAITLKQLLSCVAKPALALETRTQRTIALLSTGAQRIYECLFLMGSMLAVWRAQMGSESMQAAVDTLFAVVETSKQCPAIASASANAASILNWLGVSFAGRNWEGVQLPGACLVCADLKHANLTHANLAGAQLYKADLRNTWLNEANLGGAEFGERTVCRGHSSWVLCIAYSPDGRYIASAGADRTVRQWVAATGEPRCPPMEHPASVCSVAFSPDGRFLVSGCTDKIARQWIAVNGQRVGADLSGHSGYVTSVAYSPNGLLIATGSADNAVRQWIASTSEPFGAVLTGHTGYVTCVSYSADSLYLLSSSADRTVRQWASACGTERCAPIAGHTNHVTCARYSMDDMHIVTASADRTIRQWYASTGVQRGPTISGHAAGVASVCYSRDGNFLLSGSADGTTRQWLAANGRQYGLAYAHHGHYVMSVCYSPDGRYIASAGMSGLIHQTLSLTGTSYRLREEAGKSVSVDHVVTQARIARFSNDRKQLSEEPVLEAAGAILLGTSGLTVEQVAFLRSRGCVHVPLVVELPPILQEVRSDSDDSSESEEDLDIVQSPKRQCVQRNSA